MTPYASRWCADDRDHGRDRSPRQPSDTTASGARTQSAGDHATLRAPLTFAISACKSSPWTCGTAQAFGARWRATGTVISAVHGFAGPGGVSPASVDRDGNANLIDAAAALGADVILMSVVGASPQHPIELFRAKHTAEQHLIESGGRWTIVRSTAFLEAWDEIMTKPIVFGRGENPINFVSVDDVAAAVERAVLVPDLRGHVIEIGGPRNLTFNQLAALLEQARGTSRRVRHILRRVLRIAAPFSCRARAALAVDTTDMAFNPHQPQPDNQPLTEPIQALARR